MKLLDKLKNALFEEEYVEVEEKPKKKDIRKEKLKKEEVPKVEKPIAKKIVPKEPVKMEKDELEEQPEKIIKEEKNDFKFPMMDDTDFEMERDLKVEEPKVKKEVKKQEVAEPKKTEKKLFNKEKRSKPYGLDDFELPEPEHGLYEKKDNRTYFQPSPIISPIYGILDKNYKKEEIRDKKEIRLTSSYAHENLDLDEVRNKAYGNLNDDFEKEFSEPAAMEIEEEEEENQLLDLSASSDTPEVKKVTMGDAEEYFEDLGLEYNVDYKDISKEKASGRRTKKTYEEEENDQTTEVKEENVEKSMPKEEIKEDKKANDTNVTDDSDDDNLFDLIDSMYDKE